MALRSTERLSSPPVPLKLKRFPAFDGRLKYRIDTTGSIRFGVVILDNNTVIAEAQIFETDRRHFLECLNSSVESALTKQMIAEGSSIKS